MTDDVPGFLQTDPIRSDPVGGGPAADPRSPRLDPTWQPQTVMVHGGTRRSQFDETSEAIWATSGFVYGSAEEAEAAFRTDGLRFVYSRFRNPTVAMFEERMAAYEGSARGFATASGMAAVFAALMCQVQAGDRVVAPHALFGSCLHIVRNLLPRYGVEPVLVDGTDLDQWRSALKTPARCVFLETPSNPTLDIVDLRTVATLAHDAGALVVVDNVFATPVLQKPLTLGADVVVYSATKHIDGQGRGLGGIVLCDDAFAESLAPFLRHTGPTLSPFNAWTMLKGLETLELRVRAQCEAAARLAAMLHAQPAVTRLRYPGHPSHPQHELAARQMAGGGTLIAWDMRPAAGDQDAKAAAFRFLNALRLARISNNLGDAKSLITHPATTTHQRLSDAERARVGIGPGTLRLSVGLEHPDDLARDLWNAFQAVGPGPI